MPVTARLSRLFYDRLVRELVDWFNSVDATYRADLRELNEINYARFGARVEQRLEHAVAELRVEFHTGLSALRTEMHQEISSLRAEMHTAIGELRSEVFQRLAQLETHVERRLAAQLRWQFGMWVTVMLAIGAMLIQRP